MVFFKEKITLEPHCKCLSKVSSEFHINQTVCFTVFSPKHHRRRQEAAFQTLDVRRALAFYLYRIKQFRESLRLFISIMDRSKSPPKIQPRWISGCIISYYNSANIQPPPSVLAHSTWSHSTSVALLKDVPVAETYRAAIWMSVHTFSKHCALVHASRSDAAVGNAVLSSVLDTSTKPPSPCGNAAWESPAVDWHRTLFEEEEVTHFVQ